MIDGLRHRDRNIRYAASVELTAMVQETFGYDYDGRKRDRDRAAKQWEKWWKSEAFWIPARPAMSLMLAPAWPRSANAMPAALSSVALETGFFGRPGPRLLAMRTD